LVCRQFWAAEAALSFGVLAHNLVVLFERKLGWLEAVTLDSLRYLVVRYGRHHQPAAGKNDHQARCHGRNAIGGTRFGRSCSRRIPIAMLSAHDRTSRRRGAGKSGENLTSTLLLHGYGLDQEISDRKSFREQSGQSCYQKCTYRKSRYPHVFQKKLPLLISRRAAKHVTLFSRALFLFIFYFFPGR